MALTDNAANKKEPKGPDKKEKMSTKVIVRRLPPTMDQETFFNQISPVPTYDYFYMVRGDAGLGENSFARAYINFTNPNDIFDFKDKFDNYVFLDNAGHEYPAVVEFAAFQKIPKRRHKAKVDSKIGTIESDSYYLEFVEMINKPPTQEEKPEYSYQLTKENKNDMSTPLLEFVKHKRAEKMRIREERREERKRKEMERKKFRDEERRKRFEEKSPSKKHASKGASPKESKNLEEKADLELSEKVQIAKAEEKGAETSKEAEKFEKPPGGSHYKHRDKKFDDRDRKGKDAKQKFQKKEYEKKEFKGRDYKDRDFNRGKQLEEFKNKEEGKVFQKKVKKYSEKREERKMEAQKKLEQQISKDTENAACSKEVNDNPPPANEEKRERKDETSAKSENVSPKEKTPRNRDRDSDSQNQRRIRNKDRPTIALYRPGMLSKKKQNGDGDGKDAKKEEKN